MSFLRYDVARLTRGPSNAVPGVSGNTGRDVTDIPGDHNRNWAFLSVVIPARNEAASLPQLIEETTSSLRRLQERGHDALDGFEIIIVDDGSTDSTGSVLGELVTNYSELRVIRLAPGVGQSGAIVTGIHAAVGNWIATLDADLQNDPADLLRLWDALPGYDVVLGWRRRRQDCWSKRVVSCVANRVRNLVLGQAIRDAGCSLRIFPRVLALRLPIFHGVHRFLGSLFLREGCRVVQVPVNHRHRFYGSSHYSLRNRSFDVIADLVGVAWLMQRPVGWAMAKSYTIGRNSEGVRTLGLG
jgi:dolichol-phosphate mannosyltransferase